jgi:SpoVK/Ycf46/Vps4 family AAA+-type ATPase
MAQAVVSTLPPRLTGADLSTIASGAMLQAVQRLCRQADKEQQRLAQEQRDGSGVVVTIEQILEGWDNDQRTPIVRLDDLLEAAKEVTPSVSQTELDRYERLREQYSGNEEDDPIEHGGDFFY